MDTERDRARRADLVRLPSNVRGTNCILPYTRIRACGVLQYALKSWYAGEAVEIFTRAGCRLALTINHPVLTKHGMIPAGQVKQGDYFASNRQGMYRSMTDADIEQAPPMAEEIFDALSLVRTAFTLPATVFDFHGDGKFVQGNINIVRADRTLGRVFNTESSEGLDQRFFSFPLFEKPLLSCGCAHEALSHAGATPFGCLVCRTNHPLSVLWPGERLPHLAGISARDSSFFRAAPSIIGSSGVASDFYPGMAQSMDYDLSADIETLSERQYRFAQLVATDEIVDIKRFHYRGPVYDFETSTGLIIADSCFISNCGNCQYFDKARDYCDHPALCMRVTERMCCIFWDAPGTRRVAAS